MMQQLCGCRSCLRGCDPSAKCADFSLRCAGGHRPCDIFAKHDGGYLCDDGYDLFPSYTSISQISGDIQSGRDLSVKGSEKWEMLNFC